MSTVPTQIRIEESVKADANKLLKELGLDMSTAVNMFLRQLIMRHGMPFSVTVPQYKQEVLDAMAEAERISRDPYIKGYSDLDELFRELDS